MNWQGGGRKRLKNHKMDGGGGKGDAPMEDKINGPDEEMMLIYYNRTNTLPLPRRQPYDSPPVPMADVLLTKMQDEAGDER